MMDRFRRVLASDNTLWLLLFAAAIAASNELFRAAILCLVFAVFAAKERGDRPTLVLAAQLLQLQARLAEQEDAGDLRVRNEAPGQSQETV